MGEMSVEDKGYLNTELAKMKKQLREMDERKAKKRAEGGRRKGGPNKTYVTQGASSGLSGSPPPAVLPTYSNSPIDMGAPKSNFPQIPDFPAMDALPPPDQGGLMAPYGLSPPHILDDFPPLSDLPNPNDPIYQGLGYPQPPAVTHAQIEEVQEPGQDSMNSMSPPEAFQGAGKSQALSPPPKQKSRLSPRWFPSSLPK